MTEPVRFDVMLSYRDQKEVIELVRVAAREANIRPAQFIRSAVHLALQMAGHSTTNIGGDE
jgi:hypothetical protein